MGVESVSVGDDLLWELHGLIFEDQEASMAFKVDLFDGLRVIMFFDEHPPPHFAVTHDEVTVSFSIEECSRLRGNRGLERYEAKIRKWWRRNKKELARRWNASRPSDCPVGPILGT